MVPLAVFYALTLPFCAAVRRRPSAQEDGPAAASLLEGSARGTSQWAGWRRFVLPLATGGSHRFEQIPSSLGLEAKAKDIAEVRRGTSRLKALSSPQQVIDDEEERWSDGPDDAMQAKKVSKTESDESSPRLYSLVLASEEGFTSEIVAPESWAFKFNLQTDFAVYESNSEQQRFRTKLLCDPTFQVEVLGRKGDDPVLERELFMSRRIMDMQNLPGVGPLAGVSPVLESIKVGNWTFVLRAIGDGDTEQVLRGSEPEAPSVDVDQGLMALIDVLRGLDALDSIGMVHGAVTWEKVVFRRGRAYIGDVSEACLMHDGDRGFGCRQKKALEGFDGSAYYLAPEMEEGRPTGPMNDVWSAGLFFAELCLGYLPTMPAWDEDVYRPYHPSDLNSRILQHIRRDFRIEDHVKELPLFAQRLLSGMLEKDPEVRWNAQDALEQAVMYAAEQRHLDVPKAQQPLRLPDGWYAFD
mmetsp:Transcript_120380/g.236617  ORF Transcript_120380/g.236617 Transcript_120380/m.236617 type:complete len:468 (-) Transcript_120380:144-1547(-)